MKMRSTVFDKAYGSIGNMVGVQGPDNTIYMRSKPAQVTNPNTSDQQEVRSKFKGIAQSLALIISFIRTWVIPSKNNWSAYNTAVSIANINAEEETSFNAITFARTAYQYVRGTLGTFPTYLGNMALDSGTVYTIDARDLPDETGWGTIADVAIHLVAFDITNNEMIAGDIQSLNSIGDLTISVPTASAAVFLIFAHNTVENTWSNAGKAGYKAAGGTTVVTA